MTHLHDYWPTLGGALECACGHSLRPYEKGTPMTVPTNNEEREALLQTFRDYGQRPLTAENILKGGDEELADFLIAAGYRRLPVSGDNNSEVIDDLKLIARSPQAWTNEFIVRTVSNAVAALSTSQLREVEVTDDIVERARAHRWHVLSGRCSCGATFQTEAAFTKHVLVAALGGGDHAE